ncbi:MAG TPA: HesA/MoeB/ThiF family protein [Alphaproteobacteria bacterium]|nr:HesA/MoeB/ThiF family protein [Alphaproteobacteria bacterium]
MSTKKVLGKSSEKLSEKKVLIVGLGGTGCSVANLLARLKINLILVDDDIVDNTNLERQILYYDSDLLKSKTESSKEKLSEFANIISINERLSENNISKIIPTDIDLVIDCTDNIETRLLINKYCRKNKIDWIYTGAVHSIGAIYFIDNKSEESNRKACFECMNGNKDGETSCEIGVLNSLVVIVASFASNLAVSYLSGRKIEDKMLRINLNDNSINKISVKKNHSCIVCN